MRRLILALTACLAPVSPAFGQSQSINGTIEGTVLDTSGAVLPGVSVTVTNTETGTTRTVVTNGKGLYRAPLLPLGSYQVAAELSGFKKFEQSGVRVSAGQTAVINFSMGVGNISEVVSVNADAPIVDPGKIDLGRNLNEREVKTLPLVSRNPYNFALLQPGVTGYENSEFGVPRFSANGTLLRINYQIDGNTNTQKDRAGLRLLPISEVMVREVKVVTSGYAPEFGQTTGMVYNVVTPSGTNNFRGNASYRGRRKDFSARPFYFQNTPTITDKPDTSVNTFTAEVGGPMVRDRLHFFVGYERTSRDLSADRVITISPTEAARIGLSGSQGSGVMPASQAVSFLMPKFDYQLSQNHRLMARYILFRNQSPNNVNGGLNSTQTATDFTDAMDSAAAQIVSTFGSNRLNEVRVQFARRHQSRITNSLSGIGPAITISGIAAFGGPFAGSQDAGFDFRQNIWQVIENFTFIHGDHNFKVGADMQFVHDERTSTMQHLHVRLGGQVPGGEQRHGPLQLHEFPAVHRAAEFPDGHVALQPVRAGRLAADVRSEAALWRALRPVQLPEGRPERAVLLFARFPGGEEQLRPAPGRGLDAQPRQENGASCQHRADVRPAAAGRVRERRAADREPQRDR